MLLKAAMRNRVHQSCSRDLISLQLVAIAPVNLPSVDTTDNICLATSGSSLFLNLPPLPLHSCSCGICCSPHLRVCSVPFTSIILTGFRLWRMHYLSMLFSKSIPIQLVPFALLTWHLLAPITLTFLDSWLFFVCVTSALHCPREGNTTGVQVGLQMGNCRSKMRTWNLNQEFINLCTLGHSFL